MSSGGAVRSRPSCSGALGYPLGNEVRQASGYWFQPFLGGQIYVSPRGAFPVDSWWGGFLEAHAARGGGTGSLGYPKGNEFFDTTTRTWSQVFERGRIHIGPAGTRYEMGVFWEL
ncbi:LGFP repeat-containing protein [Litorihabitans aurantiacus]|uniref:Uncharacterized protein n=1 Tax=Litorihabitans aurantiacus TaxID=1930061 RepID=A0AA37XEU3_9MICO|nr:hypothetical protein [Litorihabitans aurantiacus]GMA31934.1 hypothetical protein GCM10025875_19260 [Litorihabitans aurantiacus]